MPDAIHVDVNECRAGITEGRLTENEGIGVSSDRVELVLLEDVNVNVFDRPTVPDKNPTLKPAVPSMPTE